MDLLERAPSERLGDHAGVLASGGGGGGWRMVWEGGEGGEGGRGRERVGRYRERADGGIVVHTTEPLLINNCAD